MSEDGARLAYAAAMRALAISDNTCQGLFEKLSARGYSADDAAYAVSRVLSEGAVNEERYADRLIDSCYEKMYGRAYIENVLDGKKFSQEARLYASDKLDALDFSITAKRFYAVQKSKGIPREKILSALYRRGFCEQLE